MNEIQVLDCTLRDGGYLNDWRFGIKMIRQTIQALITSNVEWVELGFLRNEDAIPGRTVFRTPEQACAMLPEKHGNTRFALMALHGRYDEKQLSTYSGGQIQRIRVTFHDYDAEQGLDYCERIMEKGYEVSCNPINIMGYTDKKLISLLERVNQACPRVFSIVDTFGSMRRRDLQRIYSLCENNLREEIAIGLHLHENLSLSYSLAQEFLQIKSFGRSCVIDGSLLGMGRVPGNLCLELLLDCLNRDYDRAYSLDELLDTIDDYIIPIRQKVPWGYHIAYSLSAQYNLHRNYAEYLIGKGRLRAKDIKHILSSVAPEKKAAYDEAYAERLYHAYQDVSHDDREARQRLSDIIRGRDLLVLAPGATLAREREKIQEHISKYSPLILAANFRSEIFPCDYLFFSNIKRYREYLPELDRGPALIVTSNVRGAEHADYIFDYRELSYRDDTYSDNSTIMLLRLLSQCGAASVTVAGFDGFGESPKEYIDNIVEHKSFRQNVGETNAEIRKQLRILRGKMKVNLLTPSQYEDETRAEW